MERTKSKYNLRMKQKWTEESHGHGKINCSHTASKNRILCHADIFSEFDAQYNYDYVHKINGNKECEDAKLLDFILVKSAKRRRMKTTSCSQQRKRDITRSYSLFKCTNGSEGEQVPVCLKTFCSILGK